jgi:hypothetical protein
MLITDSSNSDVQSNLYLSRAFSTLDAKPISLMSRDTSGDLYDEMNSVRDIFTEYNDDYGERLSIDVATGSAATLSRMQTYISTTERMHLSSHGTWDSTEGPKITMHDGYLTAGEVESWSITGGLCKFIYLSACNSMGHDGILDTDLAIELRTRTSIEAVIGFKDVANIFTATLLSQSFWGFHVAYEYIGGISTDTSYTNTVQRIQVRFTIINLTTSITLGMAIGLLVALTGSGAGYTFVSALLSTITSMTALYALLDEGEDTLNNWELIGSNVPGLYWPSGGAGGSTPPVNVID